MSTPNPYEQLGVTEDASFEDIQRARDRLLENLQEDRKQLEAVEMAYDAVLMDRLRLRQEGRIKVPDRIRYAEKVAKAPTEPSKEVPQRQLPEWITRTLDNPSRADIVWPLSIYGSLAAIALLYPGSVAILQLLLAAGVGVSLYFLNRKERRFGRAVLLAVAALLSGLLLGTAVAALPQVPPDWGERVASAIALMVLWAFSAFLR